MADHTTPHGNSAAAATPPLDTVEQVAHAAPVVLPVVGGVMIFLLAFIAVYMA